MSSQKDEFVDSQWLVSIGGLKNQHDAYVFDNFLVVCEAGRWMVYVIVTSYQWHQITYVDTRTQLLQLFELLHLAKDDQGEWKQSWEVN